MKNHIYSVIFLIYFSLFVCVFAEEVDSLIVSFSDPASPGTVKTEMVFGSIHVMTYDGKDVIIISEESGKENEALFSGIFLGDMYKEFSSDNSPLLPLVENDPKAKNDSEKTKGLKKIQSYSFGVNVEEQNNVIEIKMPPMSFVSKSKTLQIVVPKRTSLNLKCTAGNVEVEKVNGEIEVEAMGGSIKLQNVSGAVVAHTLGHITATIDQAAEKPMSFSTFNGEIDVTLPKAIKATLKLKSHGDIYTDFDTSKRKRTRSTDYKKSSKGMETKMEQVLEIPINGGGPDIEFSNFSGNIYIRQGK